MRAQIYDKKQATMKKVITLFLLSVSLCQMAFIFTTNNKVEKPFTIVLDAGHGGKDPGAMSAGLKEKDIALHIALKIGKLIQDSLPEVKVLYTRSTDVFVELHERSNFANKNKADIFMSIHCNASTNSTAEGTETFVMGLHKNESNLEVAKRENAAILLEENYQDNEKYGGFDPNSPVGHIIFSMFQNAFLSKSLEMASEIENEFFKQTNMKSRGVKQAGFLVLWKSSMPSVLIETGFISSPKDRAIMNSLEGQQKIAQSVFNAFKVYYNQNKAKTN